MFCHSLMVVRFVLLSGSRDSFSSTKDSRLICFPRLPWVFLRFFHWTFPIVFPFGQADDALKSLGRNRLLAMLPFPS